MNYKVKTIPNFDKNLKKLVKKFPSFKDDFIAFVGQLKENPKQGTDLGNNCFKIRLAITAKGKDKSSGARIITHLVVKDKTVFLLAIYNKTNQTSISKKEIQELIKNI